MFALFAHVLRWFSSGSLPSAPRPVPFLLGQYHTHGVRLFVDDERLIIRDESITFGKYREFLECLKELAGGDVMHLAIYPHYVRISRRSLDPAFTDGEIAQLITLVRERLGLDNEEIDVCQLTTPFPSSEEYDGRHIVTPQGVRQRLYRWSVSGSCPCHPRLGLSPA